ncbi:MAG: alpha/beta fold hydrolase [Deltaproteobacteria bacterium]|nr:alpha/beta fold hydrolase [Deltaproteobacteria bacterium]
MDKLAAPPLPRWLDRLVPFQRYRVNVGGGVRMHVMETGQGLPVVLIHGNPTWGFLYRKVAARLADAGLRIIMPDLIGLGFSDKPRDGSAHQLEAHIRWMRRLLEQLELDQCVLGVQDWGGAIGVGALGELGEVQTGLVVLNTVLSPPKPGFRPTAFHRFARMPVVSDVAFRLLGFPQTTMNMAQGDKRSIRGATARAYRYPLRKLGENVAPLAMARMVPDDERHPSIEPLRRCQRWVESFDGPAAIVWGDRDPVLGRVRSWMERLFPQAPVTRTAAGHFLQEEVPDEIAAAVRYVAGELGATS